MRAPRTKKGFRTWTKIPFGLKSCNWSAYPLESFIMISGRKVRGSHLTEQRVFFFVPSADIIKPPFKSHMRTNDASTLYCPGTIQVAVRKAKSYYGLFTLLSSLLLRRASAPDVCITRIFLVFWNYWWFFWFMVAGDRSKKAIKGFDTFALGIEFNRSKRISWFLKHQNLSVFFRGELQLFPILSQIISQKDAI